MKIKHNKLRNTGILFELLVRKIASDVLDGKSDSFAVKLMREHFHSRSELGKELQLYRSFFNTPILSEAKSFDILDVVLEKRKTLNEKLLTTQKFALIKEIKSNCDLKQFMSGRVPSYKVYASAYKLFESVVRGNDDDSFMQIHELASARYVVVEHLKGELKEEGVLRESQYASAMKDQPDEIRHLSYKFLLERFNDKYSVFSDNQKALLREYIHNGTNIESFAKFVSVKATELITSINQNSHKIKNDVTKIKINEMVTQLRNMNGKTQIKENHITALLIAYQISQELSLPS